jgi:hypothetical protein
MDAHARHVHVMLAHAAYVHAVHAHVMNAHFMHTFAVHCMLCIRINSDMLTVAIGPKPVLQRHANSIVISSATVNVSMSQKNNIDMPTGNDDTIALCPLSLKCHIFHCHVTVQINSNIQLYKKKFKFFPTISR